EGGGAEGGRGVTARKAAGAGPPQPPRRDEAFGHRPATTEERLDHAVDERRLDAEPDADPDGGPPVTLGPEAAEGTEDEPHQAEVAELRRAVEDAVGDGVPAQVVEGAVHAIGEAGDAGADLGGEQRHPPTVAMRKREGGVRWLSP